LTSKYAPYVGFVLLRRIRDLGNTECLAQLRSQRLHAHLRKELVKPFRAFITGGADGLRKLINLAVALCERLIHMFNRQMFKFPWLIFLRLWQFIQAVPFGVELIWKFFFVLSRFILNVKLEGRDDLFCGRVVSSERIDKLFNSGLGGRPKYDVRLSRNICITWRR